MPETGSEEQDLPGLPRAAVGPWLRATLPELSGDGPWTAELISGGLSNITYRLRLPGGTVILRRPPLGNVLPRAHDMQREHRVLSALVKTPVPVPEPLALCTDAGVLGVTFYVMRDVPGQVLRTPEDTGALSPATRGALADELIATFAGLHAVSPDAVRPWRLRTAQRLLRQADQDLGRAVGTIEDPRPAGHGDAVARLADVAPEDSECTIVHGDYRLDNTVVSLAAPGAPRIAAVLDWELSTLGDRSRISRSPSRTGMIPGTPSAETSQWASRA